MGRKTKKRTLCTPRTPKKIVRFCTQKRTIWQHWLEAG
jgi:hypothetical protein